MRFPAHPDQSDGIIDLCRLVVRLVFDVLYEHPSGCVYCTQEITEMGPNRWLGKQICLERFEES